MKPDAHQISPNLNLRWLRILVPGGPYKRTDRTTNPGRYLVFAHRPARQRSPVASGSSLRSFYGHAVVGDVVLQYRLLRLKLR